MAGPAGAEAFDGLWLDEDGATIRVQGGCMQGPGGEPVPLTVTGPGAFSLRLDGHDFAARLDDAGRLLWSDGVAWARQEEPSKAEAAGEREEALGFEEAAKLGGALRVSPDREAVLRACREAELDAGAGAPLWRAAVGHIVTVLASDPIDSTVECRVPGVGDVWLPLGALRRVREGEPPTAPGPPAKALPREAAKPEAPAPEPAKAARELPKPREEGKPARAAEDPALTAEEWTGWEWDRREDGDGAAASEARHLQEPEEAAKRWFAQRSERLWQQLRALEGKGVVEQKRQLRALQLELHPDKQPVELRTQAQQLFLIVQCEWEAAQKAAAEEQKQKDEQKRREEEDRRAREAAAKHHQQNMEHQQREDWQTRDRRRREEEQRRRLLAQRRPAAARKPQPDEEESEPEEPDDPREDVSTWDKARFKEAEAVFQEKEEKRLQKEDEIRKKSRRMTIAGNPDDPRTSPVEVLIFDPNSEEYVRDKRPMYTLKNAKRSWWICDVKEEIERVGRIPRLSMRLSVTTANETQITTENELEDEDVLSELPAGPSVSLTMFVSPHMYVEYAYLLKGVQTAWRMLQWAPLPLRRDRLIIRTAMRQGWQALKHASRELRSDRALVLKAIKQDGAALEFAAGRLPADRGLVLPAVRRNWRALQFASTELRADPELVLKAMRQDLDALQFASPHLLASRDFLIKAVSENPSALEYASAGMRADRQLLVEAIKQDPWSLQFASAQLQADRELVLMAIRKEPGVLEYAAPSVRQDRQVLAACKGNWEALKHVDEQHKGAAEADLWKASYQPHFDMAAYQKTLFGGKPPMNIFK